MEQSLDIELKISNSSSSSVILTSNFNSITPSSSSINSNEYNEISKKLQTRNQQKGALFKAEEIMKIKSSIVNTDDEEDVDILN